MQLQTTRQSKLFFEIVSYTYPLSVINLISPAQQRAGDKFLCLSLALTALKLRYVDVGGLLPTSINTILSHNSVEAYRLSIIMLAGVVSFLLKP